jgi:hypothetical protein
MRDSSTASTSADVRSHSNSFNRPAPDLSKCAVPAELKQGMQYLLRGRDDAQHPAHALTRTCTSYFVYRAAALLNMQAVPAAAVLPCLDSATPSAWPFNALSTHVERSTSIAGVAEWRC